MRRIASLRSAIFLLTVAAVGCQSPLPATLLSLVGLQKNPLIVAFVIEQEGAQPKDVGEWINPLKPYEPLMNDLKDHVARPIGYDMCFPFILSSNLALGLDHLAIVNASQYARFCTGPGVTPLAIATDLEGRTERPALLIVPKDAPIRSCADLKGKRVAFGPENDLRTHFAALRLLNDNGVTRSDLSLELLPLPGTLRHLPHMRAVIEAVLNGTSDAGFIDLETWETLPETSGGANEPARDRLRIVERTVATPNRLIVAGPKLNEATAEEVRSFLFNANTEHPDSVRSLGISGFAAPSSEQLALARDLANWIAAAPFGEPSQPAPAPQEPGPAAQPQAPGGAEASAQP